MSSLRFTWLQWRRWRSDNLYTKNDFKYEFKPYLEQELVWKFTYPSIVKGKPDGSAEYGLFWFCFIFFHKHSDSVFLRKTFKFNKIQNNDSESDIQTNRTRCSPIVFSHQQCKFPQIWGEIYNAKKWTMPITLKHCISSVKNIDNYE